jgi:meiotically up-regulated gene 157 (Mug157) protein
MLWNQLLFSMNSATLPPNARPLSPNITSDSVEAFVSGISTKLANEDHLDLAVLFRNTFPRTLDTGIAFIDDYQAAISTGDIPAMWIRDSVNQVLHLAPFADDPVIQRVLCGVVGRLTTGILIDPFANAFNFDLAASSSEHSNDHTTMQPGIFERKYELDSWASYVQIVNEVGTLCHRHQDEIGRALGIILEKVVKLQSLDFSEYNFQRWTTEPTESLPRGSIKPAAYTGMVPSAFRPSDDACQLPFLVPANAFFSVELAKLSAKAGPWPEMIRNEAGRLSEEIRNGIETFGKIGTHGKVAVYAYEVDGFGSAIFMDDANLPSLLSLPLMGYLTVDDKTYQSTRALLLSDKTNPWFFTGSDVQGIGSPHTGPGRVWPLGLMTQFLTSSNAEERRIILSQLIDISRVNGLFFESVKASSITDYTRADFGWANSFFPRVVLDFLRK